MTKLFQKILSLTLTLLTIVSLTTGILAGNVELEDQKIKFTDVDTYYTNSDLFNSFKGVMPGDSRTQTITFTNNTDEDVVNMTLQVLPHDAANNIMSEKVEATWDKSNDAYKDMDAFLSYMTLTIRDGNDEIATFKGNKAMEGIKIGTLQKKVPLELTVELAVDSEMGNDFQNKAGEIDWVFAAEGITYKKITVMKVWEDQNYSKRPSSVKVNLIKTDANGNWEVKESVTLEGSNWVYTWSQLSDEYTWTVKEDSVPDGYDVRYTTTTNDSEVLVKIINHRDSVPDIPWYPTPDNPKPDPKPDTPIETEPSETEPVETEPEETEPKETEPEETEPPVEVPETRDLTVHKTWAEDKASDRPTSVTVALYEGENEVEKVTLGDWNDWSYTWTNLDANTQWTVLEVDIPLGYTPTYAADGDTITITNNAILIQTGQLNWPIFVFGGLGVLLIVGGILLLRKKKEDA